MLWLVAAILFALWMIGVVSAVTLNGFIHVALVASALLFAFGIVRGGQTKPVS